MILPLKEQKRQAIEEGFILDVLKTMLPTNPTFKLLKRLKMILPLKEQKRPKL